MASKKNARGKTWQQHAGPFLKKALQQASRTWKPKSKRPNVRKIQTLRDRRASINAEIKKELDK